MTTDKPAAKHAGKILAQGPCALATDPSQGDGALPGPLLSAPGLGREAGCRASPR